MPNEADTKQGQAEAYKLSEPFSIVPDSGGDQISLEPSLAPVIVHITWYRTINGTS